jgi:hypothetical protein
MYKISSLILLIFLGTAVIVIPDSDKRLFSISKTHGPSILDAIGMVLILIPYSWLIIETWKRKQKILKYRHSGVFRLGLFLTGLGYGMIIASVLQDYQYWWIIGIILVVIIHVVVFYLAFRKNSAPS